MFDFSKQMTELVGDIVNKVPVFSHIHPKKILVSCSDAKKPGNYGTWAQLYPMKYENGCYSIRERVGNRIHLYKTDQLKIDGREIFYILYFMMPRFQNLDYFHKLETIFHELYHASSEFDGRLRILHPRYTFHGPSMEIYDRRVQYWVRYYLEVQPNQRKNQFLKSDFKTLWRLHHGIDMIYIREPKETYRVMLSRSKQKNRNEWMR